MPPMSSFGVCSGTGATRTSGSWNRLPSKCSDSPAQARRISSTPSSMRLGRCETLRWNASNSIAR
jgi:hypothetical protein